MSLVRATVLPGPDHPWEKQKASPVLCHTGEAEG